jgi:hypothetical protein
MPAPSAAVAHHRARVGAITRAVRAGERSATDLAAAKRDLAAERLTEHVAKVLGSWPPLTEQQLDRIAAILRAG